MGLRPKQALFVKEYLIDKNGSRAAKAAGYTAKQVRSCASELLTKPNIVAAVEEGLKAQLKRAELTGDMVIAEIRKLAFLDASKAFDEKGALLEPWEMPDDVRAALQSIETTFEYAGRTRVKIGQTKKIRFNDKVRALEMLAKHFKLLTEVHEANVNLNTKVEAYIPDNGRAAKKE